jgi:Protein of unknown function (DUF1552)
MNTHHTTAIDRRHFLRGLGMALALPAFNSLNTGFAAAAPSATPRRLICIGNHLGFWPGGFFPTTAGLEFAMSKTLAPLQEYRADFTVFSHLDHDAKGGHGVAPGYRNGSDPQALVRQPYTSPTPNGGFLQITAGAELVLEHFDSRGKRLYRAIM